MQQLIEKLRTAALTEQREIREAEQKISQLGGEAEKHRILDSLVGSLLNLRRPLTGITGKAISSAPKGPRGSRKPPPLVLPSPSN
jgi:hypothetical protein